MQLKPANNANTGRRKATSPLITGNDEIDRQRFQILCVINNTGPTKIARELGLKPQTVSGVIHRRYNIRRVIRRYRTVVEDMPALICRFLPDGTLSFVDKGKVPKEPLSVDSF